MNVTAAAVIVLVLVTTVPSPTAGAAATGTTDSQGDVVVTETTTWQDRRVSVPHDLVVRAPASLTLLGVDLAVGNRIVVETGARLELHPSQAAATVLHSAQAAPPDEHHGFWVEANGTLATAGLPRTELRGVRGTGLNNLYFAGGGIRIAGNGDLADLWLHDGNATLAVLPGAHLSLRDADVTDMGFLSLGTLGRVTMANATLGGSPYAIMARSSCDLDVESSHLQGLIEPVMVNGCALRMRQSTIAGGSTGLYAAGLADVSLHDVAVRGYTGNGILGLALPSPAAPGVMARPNLSLVGVHLEAAPGSTDAIGLKLQGAAADVRSSRITGNREGVVARDQAKLGLAQTSVQGNSLVGVVVAGSRLANDLVTSVDYGTAGTPGAAANGIPIVSTVTLHASVLGPDGHLVPGIAVRVYAAGNATPIAAASAAPNATTVDVTFRPHLMTSTPTFLGPFRYEIAAAGVEAPLSGNVDLADPVVVATLPASPGAGVPWTTLGLLAAAASLVGVGLAGRRGRRGGRATAGRARA